MLSQPLVPHENGAAPRGEGYGAFDTTLRKARGKSPWVAVRRTRPPRYGSIILPPLEISRPTSKAEAVVRRARRTSLRLSREEAEAIACAASFYAHVFLDKEYHVEGSRLQRFAWFRRKQELHFVHHRHANSNFAVIHFFWDRILGTYRRPDTG
jgi:hypothetical protein